MFRIRSAATREILPGFPSPFLIGLVGVNDAYPTSDGPNPFWRARDDKYDAVHAPGVTYTRVTVEHTDDWRVDLHITVVDQGVAGERYNDHFIVQAATRNEAEDLAAEAARKDVARRNGEDVTADIRFLRAQEGVNI